MRADQFLVERGLATSRSQAQRLIASGVRWFDGVKWKDVLKNGDEIRDDAQVELLDDAEARYVSRGGLKLEGALKTSGLSVQGKTCLDVGQSTGGFTDCLLRQGATQVVGVDVGQGQVHDSIRADERVVCIESVNAREMDAARLQSEYERVGMDEGPLEFGFITGDLSFISLTLVLPAIVPLLGPEGALLMLVKPQFELQPGQVGKGGIVKDPASYAFIEDRIRTCSEGLGLKVRQWFESPITGGDGNREFFVYATK
jgi:23S rRNA (cytidine1920-2'-O)/16S rRNA (cytidine1409-2'-O)-methyltransferase